MGPSAMSLDPTAENLISSNALTVDSSEVCWVAVPFSSTILIDKPIATHAHVCSCMSNYLSGSFE